MNGGSFPYHKRQDEMLSNALCISHLYNEADGYDVQQHFFMLVTVGRSYLMDYQCMPDAHNKARSKQIRYIIRVYFQVYSLVSIDKLEWRLNTFMAY